MKRWIAVVLMILVWTSFSYAVSQDGFVLNIVHDAQFSKEISGQVFLPFQTEYKIRLKNAHNLRAVASVTVDGRPVSNLGDIVIPANGELSLERFLNESLSEGRRFKFVPIAEPQLGDPYNKDNGIIKVKFRLEKKIPPPIYWIVPDNPKFKINENFPSTLPLASLTTGTPNSSLTTGTVDSFATGEFNSGITNTNCSACGATIGGSISNQAFHEVSLDIDDQITILELRILGISHTSFIRRFDGTGIMQW